jgi:hypothetical protein
MWRPWSRSWHRQPGSEIKELVDALVFGQIAHRAVEEAAVLAGDVHEFREGLECLHRGVPVDGEVVLATEVVIVDARRGRNVGRDIRRNGELFVGHEDTPVDTRS